MSEHEEASSLPISFATRPTDVFGGTKLMAISPAQGRFISWVTDILIYIVALNLFSEAFPDHIHIGAFWISILTAVAFKVLLVLLMEVEHKIHHRIEERAKWFVVLVLFLVVFFGKLAIIEVINKVFDEVEFHGMKYEVAMILTMILGSVVVWKIFESLAPEPKLARREAK